MAILPLLVNFVLCNQKLIRDSFQSDKYRRKVLIKNKKRHSFTLLNTIKRTEYLYHKSVMMFQESLDNFA